MGKIIIFDYGHGGSDSGATLKERLEKTDTLKLGRDVKKIVEKHGVQVDETRKSDTYISLQERCDIANKKNYDYFISFHRNAFNKSANGVETYTHTARKPKAVELATNLNNGMAKVGFRNRGVKSANFKVLRSTKADAVLMEIGFIDSTLDNTIFDNNYNNLVNEIAKGILKTLRIEYKSGIEEPKDNIFYRVVTGSYNNKKNADERVEQLKVNGFDSFIDIYRR